MLKNISAKHTHYLPLVTRCPVKWWILDIGWVSVTVEGFIEIFALRKAIYKHTFKKKFIEEIVTDVYDDVIHLVGVDGSCHIDVTYKQLGGVSVVSAWGNYAPLP